MITDQKKQNRLHADTGTELFAIRQRKEAVTRMLDILKETPEYMMSDGDNMQWTLGSFINNPDFWSNEHNGKIPMSFTTCMAVSYTHLDVYKRQIQGFEIITVEIISIHNFPFVV